MKRTIVSFLLAIICLVIVLPILYYSLLSVPCADDYGNANRTITYLNEYGSYFLGGIACSKDLYLSWQGTYTGCFFLILCSPFVRAGIAGLRLFNTAINIVFFVSLFFLVICFVSNFRSDKKNRLLTALIIYCPLLFFITNNYMNSEIYTWFTVMAVYILPAAFTLIGSSIYMLAFNKSSKVLFAMAAVMGLFAAGGSINIATLCCGLYFLILFYFGYQKKQSITFGKIIPFVVAIAGTIFNVAAPGNYIRYGGGSSEIGNTFIGCLWSALAHVLFRLYKISITTPFIAICVLTFMVSFSIIEFDYESRISYSHPVLFGCFLLLCATIVNFPYTLGIASIRMTDKFEDRAYFVQDLTLYLLLFLWIMYLIGGVKKGNAGFKFEVSHYLIVIIMLFMSVGMLWHDEGYRTSTTPYMIETIVDGSAHAYSNYQEEILSTIENGGDDVTIWYLREYKTRDTFINGLGLAAEKDDWKNKTVANWYGKKSVEVIYP